MKQLLQIIEFYKKIEEELKGDFFSSLKEFLDDRELSFKEIKYLELEAADQWIEECIENECFEDKKLYENLKEALIGLSDLELEKAYTYCKGARDYQNRVFELIGFPEEAKFSDIVKIQLKLNK